MKRLLLVAGGWALLALPTLGQDYSHLKPQSVPPMAPPGQAPSSPAPQAAPDSEVLLEQLKGLVFVPTPDQVAKGGLSAEGIEIRNVAVPDEPAFRTLLAPYLNQPFTRGQLNRLLAAIVVYYRGHDRPIVDAFAPEQDVTSGTVQVVILEGYVEKITAKGNRWFSDREIVSGLRLKPGDPIRAGALQDDLDWLNANPFRSTDVVYQPGSELGATDLRLQTQDRFPLRVYGGYDDAGNEATGFNRYEAGFNWGDVLGTGQQLNYQYTTSGESLRANSGSYVIPLPWRNTLTFFGGYTETVGAIPPYIGIAGKSYQLSGRYGVPLPTLRHGSLAYKESVAAGFDYKYNDNSLEFGGLPAGGTLYDVAQFVLSYNAALTDPHGQTSLDLETYYSPGNWVGNNTDAAFNGAHTLATSNYAYGTSSLERLNRLPADWSLVLRGTLQVSDANMVPSEQLGFGGYDTVRGYEERTVNADEGVIGTVELRTPESSLGRRIGQGNWRDQWQLLAFWDGGDAYNHTPLPGEPSDTKLSSIGTGLRISIGTYLTARLDYGYRLCAAGTDSLHGSRVDAGMTLSY